MVRRIRAFAFMGKQERGDSLMLFNPNINAPQRNDVSFLSLKVEADNWIQAKGPSGFKVLTSNEELRAILRSWEGK